ncbi:MAG: hypothetical protein IIB44_11180, partial [Candidatus Marinimicrobia bacterium]|nr:hypothetical protein [Candidatus Neomarinimicrobiota bacterium]
MKLLRRLNKSWQKVQRDRHIRAQDLSLTDPEYRLWDLLLATYDWDKTHTETYGCVETTDRELAEILRWSASKVCRTRNTLTKKGLVNLTQSGLYNLLPEESADAPMQ